MHDSIDQFRQAIATAGLVPPDHIEPGRWVKFPGYQKSVKNRAGWCFMFNDMRGGVFGDYSSGMEGHWSGINGHTATPAQREVERASIKAMQAQREAEQVQRNAAAAAEAVQRWQAVAPCTKHDYLTAKAVQGLKTVTFDRAFYGYNGSNAAPTSLRIELHRGGDASCPVMDAPTPDQSAIGSAIPVSNRTVPTSNLTAKVSYLDFAGTLTTTAIVRSTAVSLSTITSSFVATDLYVAFDINASLGESISITGHVFAIHCASLDEML